MSTLAIIVTIVWLLLGFAGSGMEFAHFEREWPSIAQKNRAQRRFISIMWILAGPLNLFASLVLCDWNHGWLNPFGRIRPQRVEKQSGEPASQA